MRKYIALYIYVNRNNLNDNAIYNMYYSPSVYINGERTDDHIVFFVLSAVYLINIHYHLNVKLILIECNPRQRISNYNAY